MVGTYETALIIAIGGLIAATLFRTFLPLFIRIRAEFELSQRENRPAVIPKIENIWLYMAGINIIVMGFPLFATIDQFVEPIMNATSVFIAFFVVFAAANLSLEGLFRLADSGVTNATPKPESPTNSSPTAPP